jgi:hypothetical protein
MHAEPQNEHRWLHQLIGNWTYEHEAAMGPGQPTQKLRGRESARSLGGVWVVCEGEGEMPGGGAANTIMTLGYDPAKKHYVGTWIGSMMHNLWVYEGDLDPAGKALTLESEGPSFAGDGKMAKYRDVIEFQSQDHRTLTSHVLGEDGQWRQFMTALYRRAKSA